MCGYEKSAIRFYAVHSVHVVCAVQFYAVQFRKLAALKPQKSKVRIYAIICGPCGLCIFSKLRVQLIKQTKMAMSFDFHFFE